LKLADVIAHWSMIVLGCAACVVLTSSAVYYAIVLFLKVRRLTQLFLLFLRWHGRFAEYMKEMRRRAGLPEEPVPDPDDTLRSERSELFRPSDRPIQVAEKQDEDG